MTAGGGKGDEGRVAMHRVTHEPLAMEALVREVSSTERGGVCLFLGSVRSGEGERVSAIEYSAYPEMVEAEFDRILAEAAERWVGARIAVRHRIGVVPVGEASIAIAAAAPHRAEAFDACRSVIEEVKKRLPIWKKELRLDGTAVWVDPHGHPVEAGPR
ncbi:MAG: molybdenum cofactor biosynthesis protein MoaE [Acidimicrobiales bacterium]